ncbi:MAG: Holliday junction resolvase Hjc [Methanobacteriaceae archaeon]|jgi:Holliday junction resolvase|nr:Holliday junction resolvase Hjc [Methanobacteriaceae archaeon]PKL67264.1 MAG: Holliday junction resolvase [Methanobacteriales archaeon HGW-Methanobacteriales-1]MDP2835448.1 Holliday junction resolvase Hjc [Methanobacteriaceae archaeon]MDP3035113.1 Holliday junction resolvase Hjc [Methanobacteriaceae archaeon]MDP3484803.1 Holliday junction resolvase Hjc [Methanobacteriaceae archaeon]
MVKKGSREERDLVRILWEEKFAAMRAPASGGATKKPLPDVLAGNGEKYLAIEVKTTTKDRIYIDSPKIEGLCEFSNIFGAIPYVGIKFKYKKWRFLSPDDLFQTKNGNYRLDLDLALEKGLELNELLGQDKQVKF